MLYLHSLVEGAHNEKLAALNQNRLESLLRISRYKAESVQELLDYALEEAIVLTGSKIGYIYYYDPVLMLMYCDKVQKKERTASG